MHKRMRKDTSNKDEGRNLNRIWNNIMQMLGVSLGVRQGVIFVRINPWIFTKKPLVRGQ